MSNTTHAQIQERLEDYHPHINWTHRFNKPSGSTQTVQGWFNHEVAGDESVFVTLYNEDDSTTNAVVTAYQRETGTGKASVDNPELAVLEAVADFVRNNKEQ